MKLTTEKLVIWKKAFDLADEIKAIKPWEYFYENMFFGIEDPESKLIYFCSVMGHAGESYSLNFYKGWDGLENYYELRDLIEAGAPPMVLLETQFCIMLTFDDKELLEKHDTYLLKQLKRRYRGKNQWTRFQDFTPGLFPWIITDEQAAVLTRILPKTIDVLKAAPANLDFTNGIKNGQTEDDFLVFKLQGKEWKSEWMNTADNPLSDNRVRDYDLEIDDIYLTAAKITGEQKDTIFSCFTGMLPVPVQENANHRPTYSYIILWMDTQSDFILGFDMLPTLPQAIDIQKSVEKAFNEYGVPNGVGFVQEDIISMAVPALDVVGVKALFNGDNAIPVKHFLLQVFAPMMGK